MKSLLSYFCVFLFLVSAFAEGQEKFGKTKIPRSEIALGLKWAGIAVQEKEYTIWGAAPIRDEDGRVHLFVARWPEPNVDPAWRSSSQIARYMADKADGPFTFQEVVLTGTGKEGDWDRYAPCNPEIKKFGDTYALLYVANNNYRKGKHGPNQYIGMVTSKSLEGPWKKVGKNGLILRGSADPRHWTHRKHTVNPALVQVNGKFLLYFKSGLGKGPAYGLAVADKLEGPYVMEKNPLTGKGIFLEDASAFEWNGKVCLLTTDNHGHMTGISGGGTLWVSSDGGYTFPPEWTQVGYDQLAKIYPDYDPTKIRKIYGRSPKMERPKVLLEDGKPAWLYGPSGWTIHGGNRTAAYVLKIELRENAGPLVPEVKPKGNAEDRSG